MKRLSISLLIIALAFMMFGCASPSVQVHSNFGYGTQSKAAYGLASWYGREFHGRRTANGEIYNMNAHTAAHRTLPFGTRVRVTNLRNGHCTVVRINDRGPFVRGRVIDLSYRAARDLAILTTGVEKVKLDILPGSA